jgi:hypothetical protein
MSTLNISEPHAGIAGISNQRFICCLLLVVFGYSFVNLSFGSISFSLINELQTFASFDTLSKSLFSGRCT